MWKEADQDIPILIEAKKDTRRYASPGAATVIRNDTLTQTPASGFRKLPGNEVAPPQDSEIVVFSSLVSSKVKFDVRSMYTLSVNFARSRTASPYKSVLRSGFCPRFHRRAAA